MYYDDYHKNLRKALEGIVIPPYMKQLQMISNSLWLKEMERLTKTMNAYNSDLVIPRDTFSKTLQSIYAGVSKLDTEKLGKALRPFHGNETLLKGIDINSIAPGIAKSLTTISSSAAAIAASQSSIEKLSQGLSKSIPKLFGNYSIDSFMDRIAIQVETNSEGFNENELIEWEDVKIEDDEIRYRDVVVTKADVDGLMTSETAEQSDDSETWKKKRAVIVSVIGLLMMIFEVLDIPSNWALQKGYQYIEEHIETQNQQYYVFEDYANVYVNPETSSERLDRLTYGAVITAIDENKFWIKIEFHTSEETTATGWVQKIKIDRYYDNQSLRQ